MKKFIGNVNGKSFDNEEDFNKAANEAIKKNDGNLSISSYYSYTSDDEDLEKKDDDKFVSTYEYFLGDKKPDQVTSDRVEYNVPDILANKIKDASNKDSIRKSVEYHVSNLVDGIKCGRKSIGEYQKEIEDLQNQLHKEEDTLKDLLGRRRYYNTILDILDEAKSEKAIEEPKKDEYEKPESKVLPEEYHTTEEAKKKIKEFLDIDENTSLFSVLKKLGILK